MRQIIDHVVEGDAAPQLKVCAVDEPGQGGANHEYRITYPGGITLDENKANVVGVVEHRVSFQNGPIKEFGVNGVTQEALLAIVIDRLRSFQAGPFFCIDNAIALTKCEEALMWLQRRTRERIKREVEGTNAA